jgi:hypothetical protein
MNYFEQVRLGQIAGRSGQHIVGTEFFVYSTGRQAALAAGGQATANITIQSDSDFLIEKMTYAADLAGVAQLSGTQIVPNVNVQLIATGSGRQLFNVAAPIASLFGNGQLPFILPEAYMLPAASTLQIVQTSFEAAVTPALTLNFIGRKVYWAAGEPMPPQTRR